MGDKVEKLEEKINLMKEELHVIQTTKPYCKTDRLGGWLQAK